jgi:hypothetical protein
MQLFHRYITAAFAGKQFNRRLIDEGTGFYGESPQGWKLGYTA